MASRTILQDTPLESRKITSASVSSTVTSARRKIERGMDWPLIVVTVTLALLGVAAIQSATMAGLDGFQITTYARNQLVTVLLGLVGMIAIAIPDYRRFERWWPAFWGLSVALLVAVQLIGVSAKGSRRWIDLGFFNFQPSEFAKVLLVLFLASWLSSIAKEDLPLWRTIVPSVFAVVPIYLIKKQPDLGTALSLVAILGGMLILRGLSLKLTVGGFALIVGVMIGTFPIWFGQLEPHQQSRIVSLLDPEAHAKGAAYQQINSKVAIGSGRLVGKGFGRGTQHRLHFLPEKHTDFIFAVIAEDSGFVGVLGYFLVYGAMLVLCLRVALECNNPFGILIVGGVVTMIFCQSFINLAMIVGWAPVTGIPLPFVSFGRTALLAMMTGIGLVLNVRMHS